MIKHSKKFRRIAKKFAMVKTSLQNSKLERKTVNKRFGSRYASLQELYEIVNSVLGSDWLIEDSFDFSLVDGDEGKVARGSFKVLVRITYLGRFGGGEWIELERESPLYLADNYLPSAQKLESLFTYTRRTMLASMLGIITTESVDYDGNDSGSVLNGLCENLTVFGFADVFFKKIKNTVDKGDLELLKALVMERISQSPGDNHVLLDRMVAECDARLNSAAEPVLTDVVESGGANPSNQGAGNVVGFSLSPNQGPIEKKDVTFRKPTAQEVIAALIANAKNFNEIEVIGSKIKRARNDDCISGEILNSLQKQLLAKSKEFIIDMAS